MELWNKGVFEFMQLKKIIVLITIMLLNTYSSQMSRINSIQDFTATYFERGDDYIYEVNKILDELISSTNTGISITLQKSGTNYGVRIEKAGKVKILNIKGNLSYALASILYSADFLTEKDNSIDEIIVKSIYEIDPDGEIENIAHKSSFSNSEIKIAESKSANVDYSIGFNQYSGFYKPGFLLENSEYNNKLLVLIHHKPSFDFEIKTMVKKINNIKVENSNDFNIETEINKDVYFIFPFIVGNDHNNSEQALETWKIELSGFDLFRLGLVFNLSIENIFKGKFSPSIAFNNHKFPDNLSIGNFFSNNTLYSKGSVVQYEIDKFDQNRVLDSIVLEFPLVSYNNTFNINPLQIRNLSNLSVADDKKLLDLSDLSVLGNSASEIFKNDYVNGNSTDDPNNASMLSGLLGSIIPCAYPNASYFSIGAKTSLSIWSSLEFYLKFNEDDQLVIGLDPEIGHSLTGEVTARYVWKPGSEFYQFVNNYIWSRSKNGKKSYLPILINSAFNIPKENGVIDFQIPNLELFTHNSNKVVLSNNEIDRLIDNEVFKNSSLDLIGEDNLVRNLSDVHGFENQIGISSDNVYMLVSFMEESSVDQFPVDYANEKRLMYNDKYQNEEYNVHYHFYLYEKETNRFLGQKSITHQIYEKIPLNPNSYIGDEFYASFIVLDDRLTGVKDGKEYSIPAGKYFIKYKVCYGSVVKNGIDTEDIMFDWKTSLVGFLKGKQQIDGTDVLMANRINIVGSDSNYDELDYVMYVFSKNELKLYNASGKVLHHIKSGSIASEDRKSLPFYQDVNINKRLMTEAVYRPINNNVSLMSVHSEDFNTIQNPYPDPVINIETSEYSSSGFNISLSGKITNAKYFSINGVEYSVWGMEQDKTLPWNIEFGLNEYDLTHEITIGVRNTKKEVFQKIINPIPHITVENGEKAFLSINDANTYATSGEKLVIHGDYLLNEDISLDRTVEISQGSSIETNGFVFDCENIINDDFVFLNGKKLKEVLAAKRMIPVLQLLLD